jgi:hypothetical protein
MCEHYSVQINDKEDETNMKKKTPTRTPHACFYIADTKLAEDNTRLSFAVGVPSGKERLVVGTEKIKPRRRGLPQLLLATYCPFCGAKYTED